MDKRIPKKIKRLANSICENINGFERILQTHVPFDRRSADQDKDYGIHGMEFRFLLRKENKAVQFLTYTPIYPKNVQDEQERKESIPAILLRTYGVDVGYHSPMPQYNGQKLMHKVCPYIGGKCYRDDSGLRAEKFEEVWLEKGPDAVWKLLEAEWKHIFGAGHED